jgi:hypothetical protein
MHYENEGILGVAYGGLAAGTWCDGLGQAVSGTAGWK